MLNKYTSFPRDAGALQHLSYTLLASLCEVLHIRNLLTTTFACPAAAAAAATA
jgi:hypothetical protein